MIKLLSLFSGIGAFEKALENINEPFEIVRYCEIDKYASKAFSLIHHLDENMNLKDVTQVNTVELPKDIDFITYGFPCQDISVSGKMKGFTNEDGSLTRSGLFFEALRIIEDTKPKIAIAENVKALTGKRFTAEFKIVLDSLNDAGYKNYWAVLNAKDYGVPQNRERVFIISIRNDIDHGFTFPQKYELKLRLKDLLEDHVDDKYYIKNYDSFTMVNELYGMINGGVVGNSQDIIRRVYNPNGVSPTISTCQGGHRQPKVIEDFLPVKEATKKGYKEAHEGDYDKANRFYHENGISPTITAASKNEKVIIDKSCIQVGSLDRQGYHEFSNRVYSPDGCARTLMAAGGGNNDKAGQYIMPDLRIRKLTPKECFRLMGFDDKDCDVLSENGISNSQLYKLAGNSIVVDVLEEIFVELLNQYTDIFPFEGD